MAERTYSEQEVSALLERAAELQVKGARPAEGQPGLTLAELEAIAAEAGLDPALLRRAAAELDAPARSLFDSSTGMTATHVFVERWMPGKLTPEVWEDIVAELRHRYDSDMGAAMGMPGYGRSTTEQIGRTVEWRHTSMTGIETRVMVRQQGDGLRLRFSQRVGWGNTLVEGISYSAVAGAIAALVAGSLMESGVVAVIGFFIALLLFVAPIMYLDGAWRKKKHRELDQLADTIARIASVAPPASANQEEADFGADFEDLDLASPSVVFDVSDAEESHAAETDDETRAASRRRTRG